MSNTTWLQGCYLWSVSHSSCWKVYVQGKFRLSLKMNIFIYYSTLSIHAIQISMLATFIICPLTGISPFFSNRQETSLQMLQLTWPPWSRSYSWLCQGQPDSWNVSSLTLRSSTTCLSRLRVRPGPARASRQTFLSILSRSLALTEIP